MKKFLIAPVIVLAIALGAVIAVPLASAADDGMILRWDYEEEGGTTVFDTSSFGNDGSIIGGGTREAANTGDGVRLDGTNDYVQISSPVASLGTNNRPYALSTWVKVDNAETAGNIVHVSQASSGTGGWCLPLLRLQNGKFQATGWQNDLATSAASPDNVVADQWYQVLTSWDPTNGLRLFVDGVLVDSTPQASFSASGVPMYFSLGLGTGSCASDQGFLKGVVDDTRLYDRSLTEDDIDVIQEGGESEYTTTTTTTTTVPTTTTTPDVEDGPNGGDGNNDGIPDDEQPNVTPIRNTVIGTDTGYVVLESPEGCSNESVAVLSKADAGISDDYFYPAGVLDFTIDCATPGIAVTINQYYYGLKYEASDFIGRKYMNQDGSVVTLTGSSVTQETIGGQRVIKLTYSLTDGGEWDDDGVENGTIVDPAGLGTYRELPATGTSPQQAVVWSIALMVLGAGLVIAVKQSRRSTV